MDGSCNRSPASTIEQPHHPPSLPGATRNPRVFDQLKPTPDQVPFAREEHRADFAVKAGPDKNRGVPADQVSVRCIIPERHVMCLVDWDSGSCSSAQCRFRQHTLDASLESWGVCHAETSTNLAATLERALEVSRFKLGLTVGARQAAAR